MSLDHPAEALPPGFQIGRYEVLRVLGRGGFGVTYAARATGRSGEMVAIKEWFPRGLCRRGPRQRVEPAPGADKQSLHDAFAMFCREAEVICAIRHPHLVQGLECLKDHNTAYLVMAYVSGKNLQEHLRGAGGSYRVTPATMAQLARGITAALTSLHERGITHGDIKPDNIFLGASFEPILIDLGSACLPHPNKPDAPRTYSRHYSAIEQVDDRFGAVGPWTDIYQFSAVLYRCLVQGKVPDAEDRAKQRPDPFVPLHEQSAALKEYPQPFLRAVDAGLALLPKHRPQSVAAWLQMMGSALQAVACDDERQPSFTRHSAPPLSQIPSQNKTPQPPPLPSGPAPLPPSAPSLEELAVPAPNPPDALAWIGRLFALAVLAALTALLVRQCHG